MHYLGFGAQSPGVASSGDSRQSGYLEASDLEIAPDGSFEIALSCEPQPGNWLPLAKDSESLLVRQTFLDRERETPAELVIERVDGGAPPRPLTPERLDAGLCAAAGLVNGCAALFASWVRGFEGHAKIAEQAVDAPVFIVGLQRSGTTLLQRLLALHPGLRALASWEAVTPAPLPGRPERPDPRLADALRAERAVRYMAPDFFSIHPIVARGQEEDSLLFDPSLYTTTAEALMNVPSFTAWLEEVDHGGAYAEYRRIVQLLLWQRPGAGGGQRWLGKTPLHLEHLDTLLSTFPDARIVHTHRDPARCVASLCSMLAHARGFFSDRVDAREIGRQWLARTRRMVERGSSARQRLGESAFLDVRYEELLDDPMKVVRRICEGVGAPLPADGERQMRAFLAAHPQHEFGIHAYGLADFGLEEAEVRGAFSGYCDRYAIAAE